MNARHFKNILAAIWWLGIQIVDARDLGVRTGVVTDTDWGYGEENGPHTWGGTCRNGTRQSPIDIVRSTAESTRLPKLEFNKFYVRKIELEASNTGESVAVRHFRQTEVPNIRGSFMKNNYEFDNLHFHWGRSEHTFDGVSGQFEMHFVHFNKKYADIMEASNFEDGLVVIGVLCKVSNQVNKVLERFLQSTLEAIQGQLNAEKQNHNMTFTKLDEPYALLDLIPQSVEPYFTYDGSLTTPTCNETVTWIVVETWQPISAQTVKRFQQLPLTEEGPIPVNSRPVQPLNGRTVFLAGKTPRSPIPLPPQLAAYYPNPFGREKNSRQYG